MIEEKTSLPKPLTDLPTPEKELTANANSRSDLQGEALKQKTDSPGKENKSLHVLKYFLSGILFVIIILVLVAGVFTYKIKSNNTQIARTQVNSQTPSQNKIQESIPTYSDFKKEEVTFKYPSGYNAKELEKGYYFVSKDEKKVLGEAGISVDTRLKDVNAIYFQAVTAGRNNLSGVVEKEIPNGIKMYGKIKEGLGKDIPTLYVFIKSGNGAIVIESSGEIINEEVFDYLVNSIKLN